ncbi:MAG: phenylalanine--tRNA ligase subunit alpha [Phycisphaeraceae bacterium]|nr:phenylalanine--tRNA ligase subunit alpha [Phycisphaeraceae bacterium]MCB9847303.1 phenylalanine--tRNA ligase subunit alpha [Phycisphaeraceae bacterium]
MPESPGLLESLDTLEAEGVAALQGAADADALEAWRIEYLGSKGRMKGAAAGLKDVSREDKPAAGKRLNEVKQALEEAFKSKQAQVGGGGGGKASGGPRIDMTEPGVIPALGRRHVISRVTDELCEVFGRMGFEVVTGPELEDDQHNFVKLNIPPEHPAREPVENFYVDDPQSTKTPRMLRSQTSTVQIRTMESRKPPLRIISPGRVYRPDTVDATHSFMFHQLEGLYVDRRVSMVDLKTTLYSFARSYFGADAEIQLVPSYFPFTEPSAEFYMKIRLRPDQPAKWVELGGCGMVDPAVFEAVGYDPEEWTGFAFGFGIERIAMGKYSIPDIRMLFENDVRFLKQL